MQTETNDQDFVDLSAYIRVALPDDFGDLLSALFITGFNYAIENRIVEDDIPQFILQGYRVDADGEPSTPYTVVSTWQYRGGEWVTVDDETGLYRLLKSGEVKVEKRTVEQLVNYVVERINDWEMKPIEESEDQVEEEVIEDGVVEESDEEVDEDLLDKLRASIADDDDEGDEPSEPAGEIEAPKSA